jgi:hypothetical protein
MSVKNWHQIAIENENETKRIERIANELTDKELSIPMNAGWTISSVFAHMAFWDIRANKLTNKWLKSGIEPSSIDSDVINEVTREIFLKLPPRVAAQMAIEQARILDQLIKDLEPEFAENIVKNGVNVILERYLHRRKHLEEIEKIASANRRKK